MSRARTIANYGDGIAGSEVTNLAVVSFAAATLITSSETFADTDDTKMPTVKAVINNTASTGKAIAMAIVFG